VRFFEKLACVIVCCSATHLLSTTSSSDNGSYPVFCHEAANDPSLFMKFKQSSVYTRILEHVTWEQGKSYLEIALRQSPDFRPYLNAFRENDRIGNPRVYEYGEFGVFSPTTLRYMKVASDLKKHFGTLNNMRIVEIGGGYGGQCLVLSKIFALGSYTIVDLPGPLELTKKYLESHGVTNVHYIPSDKVSKMAPYDLVLSNYAFTECRKNFQDEYLEKVLRVGARGYLTCNYLNSTTYSKADLLEKLNKMFSTVAEVPEEPLTSPDNYIIVWK
jgi:hypothetical protein